MAPDETFNLRARPWLTTVVAPLLLVLLLSHTVMTLGWARLFSGEVTTEGLRVLLCTGETTRYVTLGPDGLPIDE